MPIDFGKKHGNGYHGNIYKKVIITKNCSECTSEKVMAFRIKSKMIVKNCPDTCDFFELCIEKSGEGSDG